MLIVLDQFEQWLHSNQDVEKTELVQSLRQCDGGRVQCMVMVRDDFWMGVIRFMRGLEVRLVEGENTAAIDLFPIMACPASAGCARPRFGVLPESSAAIGKEQTEFVRQSVSESGTRTAR